MHSRQDPGALLRAMYREAVAAALPSTCLREHWPRRPSGRLAVIACGKAAAGMAEQASRQYRGRLDGLLVHPAVDGDPPLVVTGFRACPATHPVPGPGSVAAARAALRLVAGLDSEDLLLLLLSGGASALLCLPVEGLPLAEKQALSRRLMDSGAPIAEINCVRKHLSRIKGGRLAAACAAPLLTLAISDVPGDDPAAIGSGPTVPDRTTLAEARSVLSRYEIGVTAPVAAALNDAANETPKQVDARHSYRIVASGDSALRAAADFCRAQGVDVVYLGDQLQGDAAELAREQATLARELARRDGPVCLLSGGETSVRLGPERGSGGRNTEYALALAIALRETPGIWALAADSDGIDGVGGHSGALVDPLTLARARDAGVDAADYLRRHDSAGFFTQAGGLLRDGPTGTNVNDFRAILIDPSRLVSP